MNISQSVLQKAVYAPRSLSKVCPVVSDLLMVSWDVPLQCTLWDNSAGRSFRGKHLASAGDAEACGENHQ